MILYTSEHYACSTRKAILSVATSQWRERLTGGAGRIPPVEEGVNVTQSELDRDYLSSLLEEDEVEMSVVISDPTLPDNPMIFVSDEFETQTGYSPDEAVGRNCRFLQGPDTNPHAVEAIRQGLKAETRFTIDILNYRKDGSTFVNRLRIRPIYDMDGRLMFFAGAQNPV